MSLPARLVAGLMLTAVLGSVSMVSGQTAPATEPATPTTTTQPAARKVTKIAEIIVTGAISNRPADFSLMGNAEGTAISELATILTKAASDNTLAGVLIRLESTSLKLSQANELGGYLDKIRAAKKRVVVYASDYDTANYLLASHADSIGMPAQGDVLMPGMRMELMFWRGLLDKLNLQADMIQVGKFKGAAEPYTNTKASPELTHEINKLLDGFYAGLTNDIAKRRQILPAEVTAAMDEAWLGGARAKELGLMDTLAGPQEIEEWYAKQYPAGIDLVREYGKPKSKMIELDNPFALLQLMTAAKPSKRGLQPAVAVIHADGTIMPNSPEGGFGGDDNLTPARMQKALDAAIKDPLVKSIVIRVDSPGGSAAASDEIWGMVKKAATQKPLTISMGSVAASGGYYIACAGPKISADPYTLTGSIGVVGGKVVLKGLFDMVGVNVESFSRGKRSGLMSTTTAMTPEDRAFVTKRMEETYKQFTDRVKAGRGDKVADVEAVAQGRIFTGAQAKEAGLVDVIATLQQVIQTAADTAKLPKNYQIINYPEPKTLNDILREGLKMEISTPLSLKTLLPLLPTAQKHETERALQVIMNLNRERVMMVLPYGLTGN